MAVRIHATCADLSSSETTSARLRNRFTFDGAEWDVTSEELIRTHSNAGDNSGASR